MDINKLLIFEALIDLYCFTSESVYEIISFKLFTNMVVFKHYKLDI